MQFINYIIIILILLLIFFHNHCFLENYVTDIVKKDDEQNNTSINFNNTKKTYLKNYGILSGNIPPMPLANNCYTDFNCSNYPYDFDDHYGQICQKCDIPLLKNENNVDARIVGGPRITSLV